MTPPAMASRRREWLIIALLCGAVGLRGWVFYYVGLRGKPIQDWMVFYQAASAWHDGDLAVIFDGTRLTALLNQRFADFLAVPLNLHPWVYPPSFLLFIVPFALLPFVASWAVFQLVTFAALAAAFRCIAARREVWILVLSTLLCPATPFSVFTGQNAFLTAALLVAGIGLAPRRPVLAGVLLGLLSYKPQVCLMVPVALIAARQWRVLAAAATAAGLLALASLAVFGTEAWRYWFDLMLSPSELYQAWVVNGRRAGMSMFAWASVLGASDHVANLVQGAFFVGAAGCTWWIYRRPAPPRLRLALLLAATMLASPHVSTSDAVLLGIAATIFMLSLQESGPGFIDAIVSIALWMVPMVNPPIIFPLGLVTPPLICLFIACVTARAGLNGAGWARRER